MWRRWLFLLRRRRTTKTCEHQHHPAVNTIRNYLSGSERFLVVWGLPQSKTAMCGQAIAHGINCEVGGLAKWFGCDEMMKTGPKQAFLERVGCRTLDSFAKGLPTASRHTWLIFDAVNTLSTAALFFKDLLELSYTSEKFRVLLFTHETDVACAVLRWSSLLRPIQIVEPFGCCRWVEACLRNQDGVNSTTAVSSADIIAGCPSTQSDAVASELQALWALGIARLTRFVRDEWTQSGAVAVSEDKLARMVIRL